MRQIAIYGKGGIGKSTITSNLAVALAERGDQVLQVGCDPKRDSTRMLLGGTFVPTVLETLRRLGEGNVERDTILHTGYAGVRCVEAGGPEPGVGCAGRGIIATFELLEDLKVYAPDLDFVLYDVLGDVVCGGFAVPIREGYAQEIYLVTSGELMSLYAANNIAQGIARFAQRGGGKLAGVIGNSRGYAGEADLIAEFATRLNTRMIQFIPRDPVVQRAEIHRQTVMQYAPDSNLAAVYRELAEKVAANTQLSQPTPLDIEELEQLVFSHALVNEG